MTGMAHGGGGQEAVGALLGVHKDGTIVCQFVFVI